MIKSLAIVSAVLIVSLTGCMSAGNTKIANETNASIAEKIKIGKTTKDDVRALYGEPRSIESNTSVYETWTYVFIRSRADGKSFIPFAGVFIGGGSSETTVLVLSFKKDGIVSDYHFSENASGQYIKTGAAIEDNTGTAPTKTKAPDATTSSQSSKPTSSSTKMVAKPVDGPLVGKTFTNPYPDLQKTFKLGNGVSIGEMGHQVLALDATDKAGRRVLVFKETGNDKWVTTADIAVTAPAKVALVGTAEESEDGPPATSCYIGGKVVNGFGYLRVGKGKFDQPAGAQAWTVDAAGVPTATTKLACKF